ncbi:MAG: hypothetical protein NUV63_02375 [Gallionella sp.]|nr:hypothetical protein [Gallionella sp.]
MKLQLIRHQLLFLGLISSMPACAEELGRLFFTPEQRAQFDRSHAQELRPDNNDRGRLILNGIVQRHGGERTIWINGAPKLAGKSDERSPESASIVIPGQSKQTRVKVGQKVIIKPGASEQ